MKIRNGFVSNSSSSSFVLKGATIDQVSKDMLEIVIEDFENVPNADIWRSNVVKGLKDRRVQSGEIGITLPSINYETYILKVDDEIYISTANNHMWDLEDKVYGGGGFDEGDFVHKKIEGYEYFNIKNGLVHSIDRYVSFNEEKECSNCTKYYGNYVLINGKKICAECYEGELRDKGK